MIEGVMGIDQEPEGLVRKAGHEGKKAIDGPDVIIDDDGSIACRHNPGVSEVLIFREDKRIRRSGELV